MASALGMSTRAFRVKFTRRVGAQTSLREERDGRCVFYTAEGCRIYGSRPLQCRTFPFWLRVLSRRASWETVARSCPGMNRGRRYSCEEIEELLSLHGR